MAHYLGAYGRQAYGLMGRKTSLASRATELAIESAEVAAGAALSGLLTGISNRRGLGGNTPLIPLPVPLALSLAGLLGAGTLGPKAEPHLLEITKGALASYMSTMALKLGSETRPAAAGVAGGWNAPMGLGTGIGARMNPTPHAYTAQYGAIPQTEALFREAGI